MAKHGRHRRSRKAQRGGSAGNDGAYGYTGPAFMTAGGVPLESRTPYSHEGDFRGAGPDIAAYKTVQFGGRKGSRKGRKGRGRKTQRGGGCGCMAWPATRQQSGGGSGSGGFAVNVADNSMLKMYSSVDRYPCPAPVQAGGAAADELGIVSYPAGYGFGPAGAVLTDSAHYLDPIAYNRSMAGGRRTKRKSRKGRKGRKH